MYIYVYIYLCLRIYTYLHFFIFRIWIPSGIINKNAPESYTKMVEEGKVSQQKERRNGKKIGINCLSWRERKRAVFRMLNKDASCCPLGPNNRVTAIFSAVWRDFCFFSLSCRGGRKKIGFFGVCWRNKTWICQVGG